MEISEILNFIASELDGRNALVQIQVDGEYYMRKVGDISKLSEKPVTVRNQSENILLWMENRIEQANVCDTTKMNYRSTLAVLRRFRPSMTFAQLSLKMIMEFDGYLRSCRYALNTIAKFHKIFRKFINIAIDEGRITECPYRHFSIHTVRTFRNTLTEREVRRIENGMDILPEEEREVMRAFMFSVYSGLRYSDVVRLRPSNIKNVNGNKWVVINMRKTGMEVRVPISKMFRGKAMKLIGNGTPFRLPGNSRTNILLSRALCRLHIRKHISYHCSRTTCGTISLLRGMPITTIQHILGHANLATTAASYAHVNYNTILRDTIKAFRRR